MAFSPPSIDGILFGRLSHRDRDQGGLLAVGISVQGNLLTDVVSKKSEQFLVYTVSKSNEKTKCVHKVFHSESIFSSTVNFW